MKTTKAFRLQEVRRSHTARVYGRDSLIIGAFVADDWLPATAANFPGLAEGDGVPRRLGFVGEEAPEDIKKLYVGKRVPDEYRKRGAANPIKYTWKK